MHYFDGYLPVHISNKMKKIIKIIKQENDIKVHCKRDAQDLMFLYWPLDGSREHTFSLLLGVDSTHSWFLRDHSLNLF